MAHGKTGAAAAVTVGGAAFLKLKNWKSEVGLKNEIDDTGGGDAWEGKLPGVKTWSFTAQAIRPASGAVSFGSLVGTEVAVVGNEDTGVIGFQATGLCTKWGKDVKIDDGIMNEIEVKCSGTAPVVC